MQIHNLIFEVQKKKICRKSKKAYPNKLNKNFYKNYINDITLQLNTRCLIINYIHEEQNNIVIHKTEKFCIDFM